MGSAFSPVSLFTSGSQGVWLDPSDLSTMFTDRAGTIPVTAPGQTVGKRLDKSGRGNHATAPTDTARLIYGVEPKTGRRNLLEQTEAFSNAYWVKTNTTPTSGILDPLSGATAFTFTATAANASVSKNMGTLSNIVISCWVRRRTGSGAVALWNGSGYLAVTVTNDWTRVQVIQTGLTTGYWDMRLSVSGDAVDVAFPQLETGSTATAYQRVTTAYDVTEAGVPTCHYCQYDGVDDSMSTAAIDFTATDKMSVFAGVRKLSDVTEQILYELSASAFANPNSFAMYAGDNGTARGAFWTGLNHGNGTPVSAEYSAVAGAPVSTMLTALLAIQSTPRTVIRTNGTVIGTLTGTADAGSFGNYPLYMGRRNNASFPFNGRDYGIIVVGKATSAAEITSTEAYLAANTSGVTLP